MVVGAGEAPPRSAYHVPYKSRVPHSINSEIATVYFFEKQTILYFSQTFPGKSVVICLQYYTRTRPHHDSTTDS